MEQKKQVMQKAPKEKEEVVGDMLIRILGQDIGGKSTLFAGLTKIKGISWSISNALCLHLGMSKQTKIASLTKDNIKKIEETIRSLEVPHYMKNRRKDRESGKDTHLFTTDLDIRREFDIKRLKQIKAYRGVRHSLGQPSRGQRTRSHFRKKGGSSGVKRKQDAKKA